MRTSLVRVLLPTACLVCFAEIVREQQNIHVVVANVLICTIISETPDKDSKLGSGVGLFDAADYHVDISLLVDSRMTSVDM